MRALASEHVPHPDKALLSLVLRFGWTPMQVREMPATLVEKVCLCLMMERERMEAERRRMENEARLHG